MKKKVLSLALALAVCLGLMSTTALAAGTTYRPQTGADLDALDRSGFASGSTIYLEAKEYQLSSSLQLFSVDNISFIGQPGTKLILDNGWDTVFLFSGCSNVVLENIVIGHNERLTNDPEGCTAGVLWVDGGSTVTIRNCEIFGCGLFGLYAGESKITMENSTIRDCSRLILSLSDANMTCTNCVFSGNGYAESVRASHALSLSTYSGTTNADFTGCSFLNNLNPGFWDEDTEDDVHVTLNGCTFSGNGWGGDTPKPVSAIPTNDSLTCDGTPQDPTVYKINDSNYFKIRDLAAILNGTEKQFSVGYDSEKQSVTAATGEGYTKLDTDLAGAPAGAETAEISNDAIYVDGEKIEAEVYKIGGMNYFKLRDLGKALNFYVGWSQEQGMFIDTSKPYTE